MKTCFGADDSANLPVEIAHLYFPGGFNRNGSGLRMFSSAQEMTAA